MCSAPIVLTDTWAERERLQLNKERKRRLEEAKHELEVAQRKGDYEAASRLRYATIPEFEREIPIEGNGNGAMLSERVTSDDIARVVARATGIPVQSLLKGERERLVHVRAPFSPWPFTKEWSYFGLRCLIRCQQMEDSLKTRIVGQDHVVRAVSDAVRISRAGLQAPTRPVASFLFLGPTGVGKVRNSTHHVCVRY
jgi:ATP-dependent Clp protease ATP-binding subunit ClpB